MFKFIGAVVVLGYAAYGAWNAHIRDRFNDDDDRSKNRCGDKKSCHQSGNDNEE